MLLARRWFRSAMTAIAILAFVGFGYAQSTPVSQRVVDMITVKDGPRLFGAILSRDKAGTMTIAVQREWLQANAKSFYEKTVATEKAASQSAPAKRLERIRAWIKERKDAKNLLPLLESELKRLGEVGAKPQAGIANQSQFVVVQVAKEQIRSGFQQPAAKRQLALLAWREKRKDVETRTATSIAKELKEAGKVLDGGPVDLSDRLPNSAGETDRQWAARQAIVEFDALKRIRFQGTDTALVRAGGDDAKAPDIGAIFSTLYKSQLDELLQEALGNGRVTAKSKEKQRRDAVLKAVKTAEADGVRGFRISRVNPDVAANRITVEESFVAKMPTGEWVTVWSYRHVVDASQKRPDIEKWVKNDDRVKQALQLVKGLGLGADEAQIERAIRFGAATQIAAEHADGKFADFRNRYSRRLDSPPLRWSE